MSKVDLQANADALIDEINFLRALYEAVSIFLHSVLLTLKRFAKDGNLRLG